MTSLPEPVGFPKDIEWPTPPGLDFQVEGSPPEWVLRLAEWIGLFKRDPMNADEARRIAEQAQAKAASIDHWVECIDRQIMAAARDGKRFVCNPFSGVRMPSPDAAGYQAVRRHYESAGFTWIENPEGSPGYGQTEIKW